MMKSWKRLAPLALACAWMTSAYAADAVSIRKPVPFNEDADIPNSVREECKLDTTLPDVIAEEAKDRMAITFVAEAGPSSKGRVLDLEITEAVTDGNAFTGHHKSMAVKGKLYQDGEVVGSFRDRRNSMGGAFGGFKGSCAVLLRITKEIGGDVADWLAEPRMNAKLGDLE
jgi:hypothetical protein